MHTMHLEIDGMHVIRPEDVLKKLPTDTKEVTELEAVCANQHPLNDPSWLEDDIKGGVVMSLEDLFGPDGLGPVNRRAKKDDKKDGKAHVYYTHSSVEEGIARAQEAGAIKYGQWNYLLGHDSLQLLAAAKRHLVAYIEGEDLDEDASGILGKDVSHLDCLLANINMLYTQRAMGVLNDNRGPNRRPKK